MERGEHLDAVFGAHHMILVKVRINGGRDGYFLLDTCAPQSVISVDLAQALGIEYTQASGDPYPRTKTDVSFALGERALPSRRPSVLQLQDLRVNSYDRPLDGILGTDAVGKLVLRIDYRERSLWLLPQPPSGEPWTNGRVAFRLRLFPGSWHPGVRVTIGNGERIPVSASRVIVDTGAAVGIALFSDSQSAKQLQASGAALVESRRTAWAGEIKTYNGICDLPVSIAKSAFASPVEIIPRLSSVSPSDDGILGAAFLAANSPVIFNFPALSLEITPLGGSTSAIGGRNRGVRLTWIDRDPARVAVEAVAENSSAAIAGLLPGDLIIAVDGKAVDGDALYWIPHYLDRNRDRSVTISVKRERQNVECLVGPARNCFE